MASCEGIVIRQAQTFDLEELVSLLRILFGLEADFYFDERKQRRGLKLMLENSLGVVFVAANKCEVIGMCTGQLLISTAEGGPVALVEDVVVLPAWQGRGVGTMLMSSISAWAKSKNALQVKLLADRGNTPALSFYNRLGWSMTKLICLRKKV
jgi:GNAT superfamily N-acetyltransferase